MEHLPLHFHIDFHIDVCCVDICVSQPVADHIDIVTCQGVKSPISSSRGHPLKGESIEKTPLLSKKSLFFAWLEQTHQHGPFSRLFAPVISFLSVLGRHIPIRTSHPSGSRRLCFRRDICAVSTMLKTRPLVHSDPRKSSVPYRVQLILSQILWLLANPLWTHGIGESGYQNDYRLIMYGCSRYQSSLVDLYQPLYRFTATPRPII